MSMGKGRLERFERLRDLAKRIVDDPHSIDGDTKAKLKTATIKYASTLHDDPTQALEVLYHDQDGLGALVRKAVEVIADHDDAPDDPIRPPVSDHHANKVADLLVEAGSHPDRASALDHLLHTSRGQALLSRMHKKDEPMSSTSHSEFVSSVVKQYGIVALAKSMVQDQKAYGLDEHTFTQLATEHAARLYPNDRPDTAFAKLFESEESVRRACAIAKAWPSPMSLEPMVATGASGFPSTRRRSGSSPGRGDDSGDVDSVGVSDAYAQLVKMAEQQRRAGESASQAFERIYLDPANRHLAEAERSANRPQPTTYFPTPR
jgi:hypothetical protein